MIEISNLFFNYQNKEVLKIKNLKLDTSKISILMGANGSGKSVLLKQMLMLEHFDGGEYEILGYKLKNINEKDALALRK
ncbi:ATP-binding cassette domain-containing protein, partial [Campylobacter jejuni]|nr:ATP-binding cassette domain-containing protein [Campylobacter jejuni]